MIIDTLMVLWRLMRRTRCVKVFSLIVMTCVSIMLILLVIGLPLFSRQSSLDSYALMHKIARGHVVRKIYMTPVISSVPSLSSIFVPASSPALLTPVASIVPTTCIPLSTPVPPPDGLEETPTAVMSPTVSSRPSFHVSHASVPHSRGKVSHRLEGPTLNCLQARG